MIEVIQLTNRTIIKPSMLIFNNNKKKRLRSDTVHSRNLDAEFWISIEILNKITMIDL